MRIKQYKQFQFKINSYYPTSPNQEYPIAHIAMFFYNGFRYIYRIGTLNFIEQLNTKYKNGMKFEMIELSIDNDKNLVYIHESTERSLQAITPEIEDLLEHDSAIELCQQNFLRHIIITKNNLIHLLFKWDDFVKKQVPYFLIYLDDKDWYETISFETEEAMKQFVEDHLQK